MKHITHFWCQDKGCTLVVASRNFYAIEYALNNLMNWTLFIRDQTITTKYMHIVITTSKYTETRLSCLASRVPQHATIIGC